MFWCDPLYIHLVWNSLWSWTCMFMSFTKLGKFSFIIFSNRFRIFCSFSSLSDTPMTWMLDLLKLSQRLLITLYFFYSFFFVLSWVVVFCFLMFQIIDLILGFIHSTVVSLYIVLYFNWCILCFWLNFFFLCCWGPH